MNKRSLLIVLFSVCLLGCVSAPVRQMDVSDFIGKWQGPMTVSAFPETDHQSTYRPSAELEIYNSDLKGQIILILRSSDRQAYPFNGQIKGNKLIANWKGGRTMELELIKGGDKMRLEGKYDFIKVGGSLKLHKIP